MPLFPRQPTKSLQLYNECMSTITNNLESTSTLTVRFVKLRLKWTTARIITGAITLQLSMVKKTMIQRTRSSIRPRRTKLLVQVSRWDRRPQDTEAIKPLNSRHLATPKTLKI